jgi:hypothetical protein
MMSKGTMNREEYSFSCRVSCSVVLMGTRFGYQGPRPTDLTGHVHSIWVRTNSKKKMKMKKRVLEIEGSQGVVNDAK